MTRVVAALRYLGRLIVGKVRVWVRLFTLTREVSALEDRRDELLLRLGTRYHRFLADTQSDPLPAVTETVEDVQAVLARIARLESAKRRLRAETDTYIRSAWAVQAHRAPARESSAAPSAPGLEADALEMGPPRSAAQRIRAAATSDEKCACGEALPTRARFCPACGRPRAGKELPEAVREIAPPRKCATCGAELPLGAQFCSECGAHIDAEVYDV